VLHVRLTELHAAQQNLPPAIRTVRLKETVQNIHQKRKKSDNMIRTYITCARTDWGKLHRSQEVL